MMDHSIEDTLGNRILPGDRLLIKSDSELILKDNNIDYLAWI